MLNVSMLNEEEVDSEERVKIYKEVVREIYSVSKLYKRKSKKSRNSSIQAPNLKKLRGEKKKKNRGRKSKSGGKGMGEEIVGDEK